LNRPVPGRRGVGRGPSAHARVAIGAAILGLVSLPLSFAQARTTAALAGRVADEAGAFLPGAAVRIASPALIGGPLAAATDKEGRFRFQELPPGVYVIDVSLKGYRSMHIEGTVLPVGMTAVAPVTLTGFALEETVHVRAQPVALDPTSSAASTVLSPEFLKNIPADRDTGHILDFAPGINLESAYGGGEEAGNANQMDGVDISDPEIGGPWSLFNYSIIEEVELVGLGAPAEYGGFTGVVFNSVTRSGSNEAEGSAEAFYSDESLTSSSGGSSDLSATVKSYAEGTFQLGGPVTKDRLWYFLSGQYIRQVATEGGPDQEETDPRIFGKLTWQATPRSTLQGWLEWDHTKVVARNGDAFTPLEATNNENNPEIVWNLSWKSVLSADSILSVAWAGFHGKQQFDPHNGYSTPGRVDSESDEASVNAGQFQLAERTRHQIGISLAHHQEGFVRGGHDFKVGMEIERSDLHNQVGFPGGAFYSDNEGPSVDPSTGRLDTFTLGYFGGGYDVRARNERVSLYAQDAWRVTSRLTLNPGVRLDLNRGRVSGGTAFDTSPVAPRIGLAWDVLGDARSVVRAHYGRYYEALYATFYQFADEDAFGALTTKRFFDASGYSDTVASLPARSVLSARSARQPYLDQYIAGYDREIFPGIVASATLVYRRSADFVAIVSRHGRFVPVTGEIPDTGRTITLYDYANAATDTLAYDNPSGLTRSYRAAMLSVSRRMSGNWQLFASYVWSRAHGNVDNLGFDTSPEDVTTPDLLGSVLQTPNSLVNAEGSLTHDQTHQVKIQGTWIVPALHLSFSADYVFHSGDTWTPRADCLLTDEGNGVVGDGIKGCHVFPQGPFEYLAEPRGSRRLPSRSEIDLRAEWSHGLGGALALRVFADVFNANNQHRPTEVEPLIGDELGSPATLSFPRNARLGLSLEW